MSQVKEQYAVQDVKQAIKAPVVGKAAHTIGSFLRQPSMVEQFRAALGNKEVAERFIRIVVTAVNTNPELAKCTTGSIVAAALTSAQIHIEPNTPLGLAWLIPYFDSKRNQHYAQFQMGYKGVLDLFYRHPLARLIVAKEVRQKDHFEIYEGSRLEIIHDYDYKKTLEERGDVVGYYCIAELTNGAQNVGYAHIKDILDHAKKYSKSFGKSFSPWTTARPEMCKKTVALATLKYMPMSVEVRTGLAQDNVVRADAIPEENILDVPDIGLITSDEETPGKGDPKTKEE